MPRGVSGTGDGERIHRCRTGDCLVRHREPATEGASRPREPEFETVVPSASALAEVRNRVAGIGNAPEAENVVVSASGQSIRSVAADNLIAFVISNDRIIAGPAVKIIEAAIA